MVQKVEIKHASEISALFIKTNQTSELPRIEILDLHTPHTRVHKNLKRPAFT